MLKRDEDLAAQLPGLDLSVYDGLALDVRFNPRAKRLRLAVRNAQIELVIPPGASGSVVNQFVAQHRGWISKHLRVQDAELLRALKVLSLDPDHARVPLWGASLPVLCRPGPPRVDINDASIDVGMDPTRPGAQRTLMRLLQGALKAELRTHLMQQMNGLQQRLGLRANGLRLRPLRSLWGSLSPAGMVSLNLGLVFLPRRHADYVLAHELAHLRQRNHSPAFWRVVEQLYPSWRSVRAELRGEHGYVQALSDRFFAKPNH